MKKKTFFDPYKLHVPITAITQPVHHHARPHHPKLTGWNTYSHRTRQIPTHQPMQTYKCLVSLLVSFRAQQQLPKSLWLPNTTTYQLFASCLNVPYLEHTATASRWRSYELSQQRLPFSCLEPVTKTTRQKMA